MILTVKFGSRGWACCDGQLLPIAQNTALFARLGTTSGGDGTRTLALPSLHFFFQAEDGIRDIGVTGVQTCALPIYIAGLHFPRLLRALMEGLDMVGLGTAYVPGGSRKATLEGAFEANDLTSDPVRFARLAGILQVAPQLGLGGPTVGWLNAAFRLIDEFADPEYPRRTLTPTLVIGAGKDRVVPITSIERFATRLKVGGLIVIPDAQHEILMERDHIRAQFWAAFDSFIPGEHFSVAAMEAAAEARRALRSR